VNAALEGRLAAAELQIRDLSHAAAAVLKYVEAFEMVGKPATEIASRDSVRLAYLMGCQARTTVEWLLKDLTDGVEMFRTLESDVAET
jgi:hypothetical protein